MWGFHGVDRSSPALEVLVTRRKSHALNFFVLACLRQGVLLKLNHSTADTAKSSLVIMRQRYSADDADAGAGTPLLDGSRIETAPSSTNTINSANTDLDFFEDKITEPVLVLGVDITHWNDQQQFLYCASGVFGFSLCYGYLQELLSVTLCSRKLGLFLAMMQFLGYTILAYCMRIWVYHKHHQTTKMSPSRKVPLAMYLGLSLLRAIDLAM